jgi:hypothetical protein
MANQLSPALIAQLYAQESDDPFLLLSTLTHPSFSGPIRLVNNTENIVSNGETFVAFPMNIRLPADDGETVREVAMEFDNVSLELVDEFRAVTTPIEIRLDLVLASNPDYIQLSFTDLKLRNINYNKQRISAKLTLDSFLNIELTSEKYGPSNYPGLF